MYICDICVAGVFFSAEIQQQEGDLQQRRKSARRKGRNVFTLQNISQNGGFVMPCCWLTFSTDGQTENCSCFPSVCFIPPSSLYLISVEDEGGRVGQYLVSDELLSFFFLSPLINRKTMIDAVLETHKSS